MPTGEPDIPGESPEDRKRRLKRAKDKRYRERNAEAVAARKKAYAQSPEGKAARAAWRLDRADEYAEYAREWRKANPEKAVLGRQARRARLQELETEPYTAAVVIDTYGTACHICLEEVDLTAPRHAGSGEGWQRGLHIDHVIPIREGGPDILSNVRPSHALCNLRKG